MAFLPKYHMCKDHLLVFMPFSAISYERSTVPRINKDSLSVCLRHLVPPSTRICLSVVRETTYCTTRANLLHFKSQPPALQEPTSCTSGANLHFWSQPTALQEPTSYTSGANLLHFRSQPPTLLEPTSYTCGANLCILEKPSRLIRSQIHL